MCLYILCVCVFSGVFASGGRDGVIEVWDMRVTKQISHEIRPRRVGAGESSGFRWLRINTFFC